MLFFILLSSINVFFFKKYETKKWHPRVSICSSGQPTFCLNPNNYQGHMTNKLLKIILQVVAVFRILNFPTICIPFFIRYKITHFCVD